MADVSSNDEAQRRQEAAMREGLELVKWCGFAFLAFVLALVSYIVIQFSIALVVLWELVFVVSSILLALACVRWRPEEQTSRLANEVTAYLLLVAFSTILLSGLVGSIAGLFAWGLVLGAVVVLPNGGVLIARRIRGRRQNRPT